MDHKKNVYTVIVEDSKSSFDAETIVGYMCRQEGLLFPWFVNEKLTFFFDSLEHAEKAWITYAVRGLILNPSILETEISNQEFETLKELSKMPRPEPLPEEKSMKTLYIVRLLELNDKELSLEEIKNLVIKIEGLPGIKKMISRYGDKYYVFFDLNDAKIFWNTANALGCILAQDIIEIEVGEEAVEEMEASRTEDDAILGCGKNMQEFFEIRVENINDLDLKSFLNLQKICKKCDREHSVIHGDTFHFYFKSESVAEKCVKRLNKEGYQLNPEFRKMAIVS